MFEEVGRVTIISGFVAGDPEGGYVAFYDDSDGEASGGYTRSFSPGDACRKLRVGEDVQVVPGVSAQDHFRRLGLPWSRY